MTNRIQNSVENQIESAIQGILAVQNKARFAEEYHKKITDLLKTAEIFGFKLDGEPMLTFDRLVYRYRGYKCYEFAPVLELLDRAGFTDWKSSDYPAINNRDYWTEQAGGVQIRIELYMNEGDCIKVEVPQEHPLLTTPRDVVLVCNQ